MPVNVIKKSFEYCTENKLFFLFILILFFLCQYLADLIDSRLFSPIVMSLLMMGYGLQVTQDIINGGTRLPKLYPKKILNFGIKGVIISTFYSLIQTFFLIVVADYLNFPKFELEDFFLNYMDSLHIIWTHDFVSCIIFLSFSFIIVYITTFFMELALAKLADGGKLTNAFSFVKIKHAIDIIGWKNYIVDYSKIIFSITCLTFLLNYTLVPVNVIDSGIDAILFFLIFAIEYIGIGHIYKIYKKNKVLE